MIRPAALLLLLLILAPLAARGQGIGATETIPLSAGDSTIFLSHDFVVPESLTLQLDSAYTLQTPLDFTLDARFGLVRLTPFLRRLLADTTRGHSVTARYGYRPIQLPKEYYRRKLVTLVDSTGATRQVAQERSGTLSGNSIFGKNFQRSGSIVRGFTIGSNRDLTLQSGLRLQFSGNITDDVEVLGALTDEQTPIQPEGNTQTLREVDNIFIEFRSPYVGATIGKFNAASGGATGANTFTAFSRKLQGVRAIGRYGRHGSTEVIAAVSPGKFLTQQIQGRERDQGPYRLTGPNGERDIIVVAGTEHVFVDGVAMVRGQNNDYVIDYSTGEIFFQTRRPITSANRITVDFEYTDRQYSRSFVAVSNTGVVGDSLLSVTAGFIREADNPDATIDISLTDQDKALLASAGGDRLRAVRSGVSYVGRDSVKGTYLRVDTLIDGRPDSVFHYAPDDQSSVYNITFSLGPDGRGDYENVAFGQYNYVGKGLGRYLPVVYLPLPQLRQIGSLGVRFRPTRGVDISGEVGYSGTNLNRFSILPEAQKQGGAYNARAEINRDTVTIGGANIGAIRFSGGAQYINAGFEPLERIGSVDFSNEWNTSTFFGESGLNDFKAEGRLSWLPVRPLEISAYGGTLLRGSLFRSYRQVYAARLAGDTLLPSADYSFELITTADSVLYRRDARWMKQFGGVSYRLGPFIPGFRFGFENREDRSPSSLADTLLPSTFRYFEYGPDLQIRLPFMATTASARYRVNDSVRYAPTDGSSRYFRDGDALSFTLHGELLGIRELTSLLDLTVRKVKYDSVPSALADQRLDKNTILMKSQTRWSPFDRGLDLDALYDVQTEQAARIQYVFVQVPYGQGQYVWIDRDGNGVASDDEFRYTTAGDGNYLRFDLPTERLYPVIDLHTSARVRLQPTKILGAESGLGRLLAPLTSETFLRLEEKSQDERESDIYLLRLSKFLSDSTTITGNSLLQQDFNLFETNPEYSFRLRYLERRSLTRLVNTVERTSAIERSLRVRWQPTIDVGIQLDLGTNNGLLRSSDTGSIRAYDLSSLTATNDFSYRPEQSLELGWVFKLTSTEDVHPTLPRTTFLSSNAIRAVYSIETRGRLRGEIERTNVTGENLEGGDVFSLPYQLTEGYAIGTTWIARASFEYRFGGNIQASVTYTGRAQPPSNRVIHTGQAEVRAFF